MSTQPKRKYQKNNNNENNNTNKRLQTTNSTDTSNPNDNSNQNNTTLNSEQNNFIQNIPVNTTVIKNTYLEQLRSRANETQSLILCTICQEIAKDAVYAPCRAHMYCFKCWTDYLLSLPRNFTADAKDFTPITVECPQCKIKETITGCQKLVCMSNFVPTNLYQHIFNLTSAILITEDNTKQNQNQDNAKQEFLTDSGEIKQNEELCYDELEGISTEIHPEIIKIDSETKNEIKNEINNEINQKHETEQEIEHCPFQQCKINLKCTASTTHRQQHLLEYFYNNITCPNQGCKYIIKINLQQEKADKEGEIYRHAKQCKFFQCTHCEGTGYTWAQIQQHQRATERATERNDLNRYFTPREYELHHSIQDLFSFPRFLHTAPHTMHNVINLLDNLITQASMAALDQADSIEMSPDSLNFGVLFPSRQSNRELISHRDTRAIQNPHRPRRAVQEQNRPRRAYVNYNAPRSASQTSNEIIQVFDDAEEQM